MKRPFVFLCFLSAAVILVSYSLFPERSDPFSKKETERYRGAAAVLQGTVSSCEERGDYAVLLLSHCFVGNLPLHTVRVTLSGPDPEARGEADPPRGCRAGETVLVKGRLASSRRAGNPGQFSEASYDRIHHITCRMSGAVILGRGGTYSAPREAMARLRRVLWNRLRRVYPEDTEEVLGAMLLGRRADVAEETRLRFESGGVSHMLVISSLHLSILSAVVFWVLRRCRCPAAASALISSAVLLFYVVLTGCSVSSLRAVTAHAFAMGAQWSGRTYDRVNALAFAGLLILCGDPAYLFYSSFQLSFLAASLCLFAEGRGKAATAVILHFGMAPLIAWHFFEIPLLGVPVNLLLIPLLPAVLLTGAAGLALGGAATLPAAFLVRLYIAFLGLLSGESSPDSLTGRIRNVFPFVRIVGRPSVGKIFLYYMVFLLFLALLFVLHDRKEKLAAYALLPVLVFVIGFHGEKLLNVSFLDVGQGDSIVVRTPEEETVLIDGGSSSVRNAGKYRILPYLKFRGVARVDLIAATHADADHINGILEILEMIRDGETALRASRLLLPDVPEELEREEGYRSLLEAASAIGMTVIRARAGDRLTIGDLRITVMNPADPSEQILRDANAQSLVLDLSYGAFDALLTGDVAAEGEERVTRRIREAEKSYEILKAAHHGSRFSTTEPFLAEASPDAAVISAGEGNRYGHPHAETLRRLREAGAMIYQTAQCGAVTVRTDGEHYLIEGFLTGRSG